MFAPISALAAPFTFNDIDYWVGEGSNEAALAVDWSHTSTDPPALVWGYRWDGAAMGLDMLLAVLQADSRLYAKMGEDASLGSLLYGMGYDANDDGQFALEDGSSFDETGITLSSPIYIPTTSTDPADLYAEGWFTPLYWLYGTSTGNPYNGGSWSWSGAGLGSRSLADGDWDSWTYAPINSITDFAENPMAAAAPSLAGDYNNDSTVDGADYTVWRDTLGWTGPGLAADGTGPAGAADGVVDGWDYGLWESQFGASYLGSGSGGAMFDSSTSVPEPSTGILAAITIILLITWQYQCTPRARKYV